MVTVIVPVRNEARSIGACLTAILAQDYPHDALEVIVVDGDSDDKTLDIMRALPGAERVCVLANPLRGQAAGINRALQAARGQIIVRVDAHAIIARDYVRQCVSALETTGAACVGGQMRPVGRSRMGLAIAAALTTRFAVPSAFHVSGKAQYTDTVYMGAWPRSVLNTLGGFDEDLTANEDYELNFRIRRSGGSVYLSPLIQSAYVGRQSLRALARQYFRYGIGKTQVLKKYPASLRIRQLVAPAFVATLFAGALLSSVSPLASVLLLTLLSLYVALAFAYAATSRGGRPVFWRMPLVYMTLHLALGAGFWAELLRIHRHSIPRSSPTRSSVAQSPIALEE